MLLADFYNVSLLNDLTKMIFISFPGDSTALVFCPSVQGEKKISVESFKYNNFKQEIFSFKSPNVVTGNSRESSAKIVQRSYTAPQINRNYFIFVSNSFFFSELEIIKKQHDLTANMPDKAGKAKHSHSMPTQSISW